MELFNVLGGFVAALLVQLFLILPFFMSMMYILMDVVDSIASYITEGDVQDFCDKFGYRKKINKVRPLKSEGTMIFWGFFSYFYVIPSLGSLVALQYNEKVTNIPLVVWDFSYKVGEMSWILISLICMTPFLAKAARFIYRINKRLKAHVEDKTIHKN